MGNKFDELWQLFVRISNAGGILSLNKSLDDENKKASKFTWKLRKFHQKFCITACSVFVMTMVYTLITVTDNFVTTIFTSAGIMIYVTVTFGPLKLISTDYEDLIKVIEWCRKLYTIEYFDANVISIAKYHFNITYDWSMKIMRNLTRLLVLDAFCVTFGFAAVAHLFPGLLLLEKYRAPMPFILPVKNQDTWTVFFINLLIQFFGNYVGTVLGGLFMSIYVTIFMHLVSYLDVILEFVKKMRKLEFVVTPLSNPQDEDFKQILQGIDDETEKNVTHDFDHFIQTIVDMLTQFYEVHATFSGMSSVNMLIWELCSLGTTFISGIILLLERQHYFLALAVWPANLFFMVICYANDKISEKIEAIDEALYDLPWYEMPPKQRKIIQMTKQHFTINAQFTAGGIHDLTLERFKCITEAAISNCLALKAIAEQALK